MGGFSPSPPFRRLFNCEFSAKKHRNYRPGQETERERGWRDNIPRPRIERRGKKKKGKKKRKNPISPTIFPSSVEELVRENSRRYSASSFAHPAHPSCSFLLLSFFFLFFYFSLSWKAVAFEQRAGKSCKKVEKLSSFSRFLFFSFSLFFFLLSARLHAPSSVAVAAESSGSTFIQSLPPFPPLPCPPPGWPRVNQRTQLIGAWLQYFANFQYPISNRQRGPRWPTTNASFRHPLFQPRGEPSRYLLAGHRAKLAPIFPLWTASSPFDLSTFHRIDFHKANWKIVFVLLSIEDLLNALNSRWSFVASVDWGGFVGPPLTD